MKSGKLNLLEPPGPVHDCNGIAFNGRKANLIGHFLRVNCLLNHVEGRIERGAEVTQRRGRRLKQLLDSFKGNRGYCKLKEEALDCAVWGSGCGRGDGLIRMMDESGTPIVDSSGQLGLKIVLLISLPTEDAIMFYMSHQFTLLSTRQTPSL
jgi:hypothetical protein